MRNAFRSTMLAATALGTGLATPAAAQDAQSEADRGSGNDIIVTAQRIEQRLQDVPISITVLSESTLANNNITSAKDIATFTPGLTTNNRYGSDNTTYTIRGFTQEQRTTATVGTYFADVVAPRGSGATQGGDGAGPGALFDLQNVQVLKGPQGTLFGRNSTGGAVILTPKRPVDRFEGYVEASAGDYGMFRGQAVLNLPIMDTLRIRAGVDHMERDGYLKNAGRIGFGPHGKAGGSVDYWAGRLSILADLSPDVENYTIATYSKSESTGVIPKINARGDDGNGNLVNGCFVRNPYAANGVFGAAAVTSVNTSCAQYQREAALGFWSVSNPLADAKSDTEQWQFINTTTWHASDTLTIKNIFSYAEFRGVTNLDLFGYYRPIVTPGTETSAGQVQPFNTTHYLPESGYTNAQSSLVEELQFQGRGADGRFIWQGGLYYEHNEPLGVSGIQSSTQTPCADINTFDCLPGQNGNSIGRLAYQYHRNRFIGKAAYLQASYDLTEQLKVTGGIRYTEDSVQSTFGLAAVRLYSAPVVTTLAGTPITFPGGPTAPGGGRYFFCLNDVAFGRPGTASNPYRPLDQRFNACQESRKVTTRAPTWLLGVDFKPVDDVLLYAKWSRGYRQGGVAPFAGDQLQNYDKERVDTYEIGAKASWRGSVPGYFNVSAFYNDFRDQQLQVGLSCFPVALCAQTTAVVNAGRSKLQGFEAELGFTLFDSLRIDASYAYLDTEIKEIIDLEATVRALGLPYNDVRGLPVGSVIPNAMPHKVTVSANYRLPLDESLGRLSFGGTFVYQSKYRAVSDPFVTDATGAAARPFRFASEYGVLPGSKLLNLNVNWESVGGLPVDASVFVTNVTKEHVFLHANVQAANGFVSNIIGEPRMWGARLRYRFGGD